MSEYIALTRRQFIKDEIEVAIDLLLTSGSVPVANLLAFAAIDVMRGIANKSGKKTFHGIIEGKIRQDKVRFWRNTLREAYNFSKHADIDPERVIPHFNPESALFAVLSAVFDYGEIFHQMTMRMYFFRAWMLVRHPDFLVEGGADVVIPGAESVFGSTGEWGLAKRKYADFRGQLSEFGSPGFSANPNIEW